MPVLYGVFLYMGITSLDGLQVIQRILILFMPVKYQPDYMYLRYVLLCGLPSETWLVLLQEGCSIHSVRKIQNDLNFLLSAKSLQKPKIDRED